jgi:small-conductance mechanosensitive channel
MEWIDRIIAYVKAHAGPWTLRILVGVLIVAAAWLVGRTLSGWVKRALAGTHRESLGGIVGSTVFVVAIGFGVITALDHIGLDVATLLAGAGVAGLAIGFGAQQLVKDVISGFFLIFDDVVRIGDVAEIQGVGTGTIEKIGLRTSEMRSFSGQLFYVRNGEINVVGNSNRGWMRAVVEVGLSYEQAVDDGMRVLRRVADAWAAEHADIVIEPPDVQGVLGLNDSDVTVRIVIKMKALEQWGAERDLRARVKAAFDREGIEIPFPRRVLYTRSESDEAGAERDAEAA